MGIPKKSHPEANSDSTGDAEIDIFSKILKDERRNGQILSYVCKDVLQNFFLIRWCWSPVAHDFRILSDNFRRPSDIPRYRQSSCWKNFELIISNSSDVLQDIFRTFYGRSSKKLIYDSCIFKCRFYTENTKKSHSLTINNTNTCLIVIIFSPLFLNNMLSIITILSGGFDFFLIFDNMKIKGDAAKNLSLSGIFYP